MAVKSTAELAGERESAAAALQAACDDHAPDETIWRLNRLLTWAKRDWHNARRRDHYRSPHDG